MCKVDTTCIIEYHHNQTFQWYFSLKESMTPAVSKFSISVPSTFPSTVSSAGRIPGHQTYSAQVVGALEELGFAGDRLQAVMGGNAARFLGLSDKGAQHTRLAAFYEGHPIFEELFPS